MLRLEVNTAIFSLWIQRANHALLYYVTLKYPYIIFKKAS